MTKLYCVLLGFALGLPASAFDDFAYHSSTAPIGNEEIHNRNPKYQFLKQECRSFHKHVIPFLARFLTAEVVQMFFRLIWVRTSRQIYTRGNVRSCCWDLGGGCINTPWEKKTFLGKNWQKARRCTNDPGYSNRTEQDGTRCFETHHLWSPKISSKRNPSALPPRLSSHQLCCACYASSSVILCQKIS